MVLDRDALARSLRDLAVVSPSVDGLLPVLQRVIGRAREVLRADGAALTLEHEAGSIGWVAVTDPVMQLLQEVQQDVSAGPSVSAYTSGQVVVADDLETQWKRLAADVGQVSVRSALSVPIWLGGRPVGTLDVYRTRPGDWPGEVVAAAEAFAGLASDLLQTSVERSELRREVAQLQRALTARIWIEQAKGVLVGAHGLTPEAAFERLRGEARSSQRRVAAVAREVVQAAQAERLAALAAGDERWTRADERDRAADERNRVADERDLAANERDRVADERDRLADERERRADERHRLAGGPG
jgi:GAF domain-containing protein